MEFKKRLRDLRLEKGMKSKEVAQLAGVSDHTYISYENRGSQPPYDVLIKLSKVFGVTTDFLLGADQDAYQPIVNRKSFNKNLKHYRKLKGFSGLELSRLLHVAYSTYMNYENSKNQPSYEVLCKIADILQVSTDELLGHKLEEFVPFTYAGFIVDNTQQQVTGKSTCKVIDTIDKTEYNVPKELIEALSDTIQAMQKTVCNHSLVKTMLANSL